ncbi:MAG: N-acetyltransferase [Propionibacteriaceae bacterium]|jgi:GNAT superfamily N-acetyltransferase|nr:N-acetyltransferase [Propionibacteriaceae bacterium]
MTGLVSPRKLARHDVVEGFDCGVPELDQWLTRFAWENQAAHNATTYVTVDSGRVVGYYAICMAAVSKNAAPQGINPNRRPSQIPCVLLARLAVDSTWHGRGLGIGMLRDCLVRAIGLSESIAAAAVLVHCRDENAKLFYLAHGDFLTSPVDPLQLMVPIKVLSRYFDGQR